jgi:hypothetical protein
VFVRQGATPLKPHIKPNPTMTRPAHNIGALFLAASLLLTASVKATGLLLPVYGDTAVQYTAALSAATKVPVIAIINPLDGPGPARNAGTALWATRLKLACPTVAGYVSTRWGAVSQATVKTQIDQYCTWYKCNGVFFDEMSDRLAYVGYYQAIYNYAAAKGLRVITNPGTAVPVNYMAAVDNVVTYENTLAFGFMTHKPLAWTATRPVAKFCAIIYETPDAQWKAVVDRAIALRYGWIFVGNHTVPDPFGLTPTYQAAVADYVRRKNAGL